MFKRKGTYFALFGKCCAFCAHGSGIGVWTSGGTPLGPWEPQGNIGCSDPALADQQFCGCGYPIPPELNPANRSCPASASGVAASRAGSVSHAQQNSVIKLAPPRGKTEPSFLWTGDRWQSACRSTVIAQGVSPLGPELNCVKAYDYQYWSVLEFDDGQRPPRLRQQAWNNEVTLDIDAADAADPRGKGGRRGNQ